MAEAKKRGFHALEERIHDLEVEDAKREREASQASEEQKPGARREEPKEKSSEAPKR